MTNLDKYLAEIEGRIAGRAECSVCLSPVIHHSSDEGTQSYERAVSRTDVETLLKMVRCAADRLTGGLRAKATKMHVEDTLAELNKLAGEVG